MLQQVAARNLGERLAACPYPGRGIVIGRSLEERWTQVYWIMGRSDNSRNRLFVREGDDLRTWPVDPSRLARPELVIYRAMSRQGSCLVVSNGLQTDAVHDGLAQGRSFAESLQAWQHEPDPPHNTPRISGMVDVACGLVWLSVIRASLGDPGCSDHAFYRYAHVPAGIGYAVTTYLGDGDPLPSFAGDPYPVPLQGDAGWIAATYWEALDADNRVALAVRQADPRSGEVRLEILNRHTPVPA
ncbi:MAG: IMP cyclohydrolase [Candidatus Latescibacterota bacterium]